MRKQTDFVVRVFKLGNGANGTQTGEQLTQEVREKYLKSGYEVFSTDAIQVFGGEIFYNICFAKYEDVALAK